MGYVGTGQTGHTYIGSGIGASGTFKQMGTNSNLTAHGVVVAEGNSPFVAVGPTATTGAVLQNNAGADPSYSTASYPSTTAAGSILYSPSANVVDDLATTASATLVSNSSAVPVWTSAMTNGQVVIGSTGGTPTAATLTAGSGIAITNAAGAITIATQPVLVAGSNNLGISYSSSTFSVNASDGSALSASNPAYVTIQSKLTPGKLVTIAVTSNQTFIDDTGASTINNNSFGTATATWTYDVPFFLYAVTNTTETAISFMITRVPHRTTSPIAGHIGKTGSALATESSRMFALSDPVVADFAECSCLCIGSFRMTKQNTTDWTVSSLAATDGIGRFQSQQRFFMPPGQSGTAGYHPNANSLFFNNGGTAPHTTNVGIYSISRDGLVSYFVGCTCTQTGVGSVSLAAALPFFAFASGGGLTALGIATRQQSSVASAVRGFYQTVGDYYVTFVRGNDTTASCLNTDVAYIAPNGDQFKFGLTYHAIIGYV